MSDLELELRELRVEWPETPDLAGAVAGRIERAPAPRPRVRLWLHRPAWQLAVAVVALVVAVVAVVPPARSAVLDLLGFGSVRIVREEPSRFGAALALGEPVTLEQARERFPVVVPDELGEPDAVYLTEQPWVRVDLVYREREGIPASSNTGVALLLTEFRAVAEPLVQKTVGQGANVERLTVGDDPAFFISGANHGFAYIPEGGTGAFEESRLAGNTLLVERSDGVLLRIEGDVDRDAAVRIAESVE
jgi:hypothetical protein